MNLEQVMPTVKLAERLGIDVIIYDGWEGPTWTGNMQIIMESANDLLLWHELAHYIAATPQQRLLPDYGLGKNANYMNHEIMFWMAGCKTVARYDAREVGSAWANEIKPEDAQKQEDLASASLIGYLYLHPEFKDEVFKSLKDFEVQELGEDDYDFVCKMLSEVDEFFDLRAHAADEQWVVLEELFKEYNG